MYFSCLPEQLKQTRKYKKTFTKRETRLAKVLHDV